MRCKKILRTIILCKCFECVSAIEWRQAQAAWRRGQYVLIHLKPEQMRPEGVYICSLASAWRGDCNALSRGNEIPHATNIYTLRAWVASERARKQANEWTSEENKNLSCNFIILYTLDRNHYFSYCL
jgi:hypothetical protein